jgi:hypothetical protein
VFAGEEEMESRIPLGYSETARSYTENKSGGNDGQRINGVYSSSFFVVDFILRLLVIGSTFTAAIVMGTNKQTAILPIVGPLPAKYQYSPAFVYVGGRILIISIIFLLCDFSQYRWI